VFEREREKNIKCALELMTGTYGSACAMTATTKEISSQRYDEGQLFVHPFIAIIHLVFLLSVVRVIHVSMDHASSREMVRPFYNTVPVPVRCTVRLRVRYLVREYLRRAPPIKLA
jgi:hypothetical protein